MNPLPREPADRFFLPFSLSRQAQFNILAYNNMTEKNQKKSNLGGKREGAGRPKGSCDVASKIRNAFLSAISNGKPLEEILEEKLKEDPLGTLRAISPFCPKEVSVDGKLEHEHRHESVSETAQWLAEVIESGSDSESTKPLPN